MRFVVSARRFDANGLLFSRDITSLSTPEEIAHALEGDFAEVQGGYVLLFDRRIWNSPQHALFDAEHVLCEMDSIAYAALMLEDCATHFEDPDMQSVAFAEMISLRVEEICGIRPKSSAASGSCVRCCGRRLTSFVSQRWSWSAGCRCLPVTVSYTTKRRTERCSTGSAARLSVYGRRAQNCERMHRVMQHSSTTSCPRSRPSFQATVHFDRTAIPPTSPAVAPNGSDVVW